MWTYTLQALPSTHAILDSLTLDTIKFKFRTWGQDKTKGFTWVFLWFLIVGITTAGQGKRLWMWRCTAVSGPNTESFMILSGKLHILTSESLQIFGLLRWSQCLEPQELILSSGGHKKNKCSSTGLKKKQSNPKFVCFTVENVLLYHINMANKSNTLLSVAVCLSISISHKCAASHLCIFPGSAGAGHEGIWPVEGGKPEAGWTRTPAPSCLRRRD